MAKIVRLNQPRNPVLNYDFATFNRYIFDKIQLGYKNILGEIKSNVVADDIDFENDYLLQKPSELLDSKVGWCFDIVELYREYSFAHKLALKSYFMEYTDENKHLQFVHSFAIMQQRDGLWYTCIDNIALEYTVSKGYVKPRDCLSQNFYIFKHYVKEVIAEPKRDCFYINEYSEPDKAVYDQELSMADWCRIEQFKPEEPKKEVSSMAIVFAPYNENSYSVLLLKTNHNEWVFPKGHIEGKESSKEAAIRECKEESNVDIKNAIYLGRVDKYKYQFDSYDLEMTNDMFYELFGANTIEKRVEVHAFFLKDRQAIQWLKEERFVGGEWIELSKVNQCITFANTKEMYKKAYRKLKRYLDLDKLLRWTPIVNVKEKV